MVAGTIGAGGGFGTIGPLLSLVAANVALGTLLLHRWPKAPPLGLRPAEKPDGPDERAVVVELRQDGMLIGWDVGILWFEPGGVGFVGKTVSFILPRATLHPIDEPQAWRAHLGRPKLTAQVFQTTLSIVPLASELRAETTLARIEALPEGAAPETVLPPSSMHPDLIQRGIALRRRRPLLYALGAALILPQIVAADELSSGLELGFALWPFVVIAVLVLNRPLMPSSIRPWLPHASS